MKQQFLSLNKQPIANAFRSPSDQSEEFFFDLSVGFDSETYLVSLMNFVDKTLLFHDEYKYQVSANPVMVEHFKETANDLRSFVGLSHQDKVLEIGSNDGTFIKNFPIEQVVAIEPCGNFARLTQSKGYRTFPKFWNKNTALEVMNYADGQFKLIYSANCFCHIPEILDAFKAVASSLTKDGVFVFEDPSLLETINRGSYDQFYDEHAHIFSLSAVDRLLKEAGLRGIQVEKMDTHGGSNRIFAVRKDSTIKWIHSSWQDQMKMERSSGLLNERTFEMFALRVEQMKEKLVDLLWNRKMMNKRVISYGASSKSTVVFNYCQIGSDLIECVSDTTPAKIGLLMPGVHIPIKSYDEVFNKPVDTAFLGAWNYRADIERKEQERINNGLELVCHV